MDEKILNSLLDYAREYMGAEIPFNNKWIIENFLIAERIKLSEQQSNCNKPHVIKPLPSYDDFVKIAEQMETYMGDTYHVIKLDDVKMLFGINDD